MFNFSFHLKSPHFQEQLFYFSVHFKGGLSSHDFAINTIYFQENRVDLPQIISMLIYSLPNVILDNKKLSLATP